MKTKKTGYKLSRPKRQKGEDIWAFIERMSMPEPNSGCLLWMGVTSKDGYGRMAINGQMHRVHRVAYADSAGPIPPGMHVLHRCDVPSCVNPGHMFLGTNADNMEDKINKGRQSRMRGETNAKAKLCELDGAAIRTLKGVVTQREVARRFGVKPTAISRIYSGKSWACR